MKRILFLHQASTIGGGSYCLLNILREIDKTQIKPIVCLVGDGPLRNELEKLGIEIIMFPQMCAVPYNRSIFNINSLKTYLRVRQSIYSFKKILMDNKIDIVYLNNMMIYPYLAPAKECGCKTILHCREHWPVNEHKRQLQWAQKAVSQYCDQLIAINNYSASIFPRTKAIIVHDWIDMDSRYEFYSLSKIFEENLNDKKVYLYTGGVQRIKGAKEVISTFVDDINDPKARLLIVGIDKEIELGGIKDQIKKSLAKIGIRSYYYNLLRLINSDNRIKCIPSTYMLAHIMQQCYCNLSYFTIPHANLALAECEIMGIPSIAADNDEAREYSLDGQLSLLFKQNDRKAFIEAIKEMDIKINTYKANLSLRLNYIKEKFSKEHNVSNLNNAISRVISDI